MIVEFKWPALATRATDHFLNAIVSGIESHAGRTNVFKPLGNMIHCKNGMLKVHTDGTFELLPFDKNYYSRNPLSVDWNEEA